MKKPIEYSIAIAQGPTAANELEKDADALMNNGFIPFGSVAIHVTEEGKLTIAQAFVKHEE